MWQNSTVQRDNEIMGLLSKMKFGFEAETQTNERK